MEDTNPEIFEIQTTPILEFNGATVENLVEKVNNNTSEVMKALQNFGFKFKI
jgi:predicted transcriptional regulator